MELNPVLERFAQRSPLPVMAWAVLERCLNAADLDAWFEQVAQTQYTRSLLFSSVYELMTQVVLRQSGSVRTAWLASEGKTGVSLAALYDRSASPNGLPSRRATGTHRPGRGKAASSCASRTTCS
jgi:hypothetical protein